MFRKLWVVAALVAACGGAGGGGGGDRCTSDPQCGAGKLCVQGACVAGQVLTITPDHVSLSPHQTTLFRASGGTGSGYRFSAQIAGAVNTDTGLYTAPEAGASDVVSVVDSAGAKASASITLVAAPVITSFAASEPVVTVGAASRLTAVFTGGTGVIDHGVGTVTSGTQASTAVSQNTTYTLTVTNALGVQVTSAVSVQTVAAPSIASFTSSAPSTISVAGTPQTVDLAAVFAGGVGVITPGNASVASGTHLAVGPLDSTTYTLTVSNNATTPATATATVKVLVGRRIALERGNDQIGVVAHPLPNALVAAVHDATDAGVPGVPVHWMTYGYYSQQFQWADGGVSTDGVTVTDSQGEARVPAVLGTYTGYTYPYLASVDNLQDGTQVSFSATARPDVPTHLAAASPNPQIASVSAAAAYAPAVTAQDQYNNGVPGVPVQFTVVAGGGFLLDGGTQFATEAQVTNEQGVATASAWWMGPDIGDANNGAQATFLDGGSAIDFVASAEVVPLVDSFTSDLATVTMGQQLQLTASFTNAADGTATIDHAVGQVGTDTPVDVRARFNNANGYAGYTDPAEQQAESVTYKLTVKNAAANPASAEATRTVTVLDPEWPHWPMPDSATRFCVDPSTSPPQKVACSSGTGPGQDGLVVTNDPHYSTLSATEVHDSVTGLAWDLEYSGPFQWQAAVDHCAAQGPLWRLPTTEELITLVDYGATPANPGAPFVTLPTGGIFWTASTYYYDASRTWRVDFGDGQVTAGFATENHYVRCVR